jgi:signal transduction histidine kinase
MANTLVQALRRHWDIPVAIALVGLAFVPGVDHQGVALAELPARAMDAVGWVLLVTQGAAVAMLRRWPVASFVTVAVAFAAYQLIGYPTTFAALGVLVTVGGAGALVQRRRWIVAASAAVGYVVLSIASAAVGSPTDALGYVVFGVLLASLWTAGAWLRARAQAQEHRSREAERAAIDLERSRIAREMHDVVTHHVTAMVIQADAAQYGTDDAQRTNAVLTTIGETGRAALTDLRGLLDALSPSEQEPGRTPAVTDADEAVARARAAGQPVEFVQDGIRRPLRAAAALAVTRVVEESLTNAMKHAHGAATRVHIRYGENEVEVTVTNDGVAEPGGWTSSGRGLTGLRERVALVGGEFNAGPAGDGFVVHARMPA